MRVARVLVVAGAMSLLACCPHKDGPCAPWAHRGDTYSVEILDHVELEPEARDAGTAGMLNEAPCPDFLGVARGQVIPFEVVGKQPNYTAEEGCGCYMMMAEFDLPGVTRAFVIGPEPNFIGAAVAEQSGIETASGCRGNIVWRITGAQVFGSVDAGPPITDFTFRRGFRPRQDARMACEAEGFPTNAWSCEDAWQARVRRASGTEVVVDP